MSFRARWTSKSTAGFYWSKIFEFPLRVGPPGSPRLRHCRCTAPQHAN